MDQVRLEGRLYSNKPPALAFAGAAVYATLKKLFGWHLGGGVIGVTTICLVAFPAAILVLLFYGALGRFSGISPGERVLWTVASAAGTLLWPYATTLNSHVPTAALLLVALLAALDARPALAGGALGAAALFDLLPGAGLAPFFLAILLTRPGAGLWRRFLLAFGAVSAAGLLMNWLHHGALLPLKLVRGAVDLSAQAGPSAGGVVLPANWSYPLELLFSGHGILFVSPILVLGLFGLVAACREAPFASTGAWRWLAAGIAVQFVGHALLAGSYGGWAYGYRYLLPIQPLLLLAGPWAMRTRPGWRRAVVAALLPVSILFAALGAYHPWPPAFEQESSSLQGLAAVAAEVRNPVGGNAAAWLAVHAPESAITRRALARWVSSNPQVVRRYLMLFFGSKGDFATMRQFGEGSGEEAPR